MLRARTVKILLQQYRHDPDLPQCQFLGCQKNLGSVSLITHVRYSPNSGFAQPPPKRPRPAPLRVSPASGIESGEGRRAAVILSSATLASIVAMRAAKNAPRK